MANWQTDGCRKDELEVSNSYSMHILRARNLSKYYAYALITNTSRGEYSLVCIRIMHTLYVL